MIKAHTRKKPVHRLPPARYEIYGGEGAWFIHDNEAKRGGETYEFDTRENAMQALKVLNPGSVICMNAYREKKNG